MTDHQRKTLTNGVRTLTRLSGLNIAVFGAAGTIGAAVTREIVRQGAVVAAADLEGAPLEQLTRDLKDLSPESLAEPLDATDHAAVTEFLQRAAISAGRPADGIVNVAGYWEIVEFLDSDADHWQKMIRANLITALTTCHVALPSMLSRGSGSIVNFASTAGEFGSIRPSAAYAASKGGVIGFTKSLAREVSPLGVRVNAISPGPIDTPMLQAASPEQRAVAASRTLVGRLGTPADIAHGVVYLLSDESSFVTGDVLRVNGGSLI